MKMNHNANCVFEKYGHEDATKWKCKQDILTYLQPLNQDKDAVMLKSHKGTEEYFLQWKDCKLHIIENNNYEIMKQFDLWLSKNNEEKDSKEESNE